MEEEEGIQGKKTEKLKEEKHRKTKDSLSKLLPNLVFGGLSKQLLFPLKSNRIKKISVFVSERRIAGVDYFFIFFIFF